MLAVIRSATHHLYNVGAAPQLDKACGMASVDLHLQPSISLPSRSQLPKTGLDLYVALAWHGNPRTFCVRKACPRRDDLKWKTKYMLWWVDPGWQVSPYSVPCSLPPRRTGERIKRAKARKLLWVVVKTACYIKVKKNKKTREERQHQPSDAKAITHHLPPADRCPANV